MVNIRAMVVELLDALENHIGKHLFETSSFPLLPKSSICTPERDKLRLLLQYSRKLSAFQKRATLVQECLEEVLENDDDLAAMYLTAKLSGTPRDASEHEEIELLLESFSKQCEEIVSEVENLSAAHVPCGGLLFTSSETLAVAQSSVVFELYWTWSILGINLVFVRPKQQPNRISRVAQDERVTFEPSSLPHHSIPLRPRFRHLDLPFVTSESLQLGLTPLQVQCDASHFEVLDVVGLPASPPLAGASPAAGMDDATVDSAAHPSEEETADLASLLRRDDAVIIKKEDDIDDGGYLAALTLMSSLEGAVWSTWANEHPFPCVLDVSGPAFDFVGSDNGSLDIWSAYT
ncbi:magnesium transporter, partial [Phenoliferia sp. Uapishka_3]